MVGIVVEYGNLIAAVKHRNTFQREHQGVQHSIGRDTGTQSITVLLKQRCLDTAERCSCAAKSGVLQPLRIIVQLAARRTPRPSPCKPIIQILLVLCLTHAKLSQKSVVQTPADIVMASEIILEQIGGRNPFDLPDLML